MMKNQQETLSNKTGKRGQRTYIYIRLAT